jgi:hypothetical protein
MQQFIGKYYNKILFEKTPFVTKNFAKLLKIETTTLTPLLALYNM